MGLHLSSDKFEETKKMQFTTATTALPRMLHGSINGDKYENWILVRRDQKYEFYSGGDILDTTKFAIYNSSSCPVDIFETIGDVNGDSINDLAVALASNGIPNCFKSANASASVGEDVTKVISIPIILLTLSI